jgi:hypothetical protein
MPLHDHCRPPLAHSFPWESIHSGWASEIARRLNQLMPSRYYALENTRFGNEIEIDIGTFDQEVDAQPGANGPATATLVVAPWAPPAPAATIPARLPDWFEVRVFLREGRPKLVGAIELVSPRNKDRPSARQGFLAKCAGYLSEGVSLVVIDAVTERPAHLHAELLELFGSAESAPPGLTLFAGAYRPVVRNGQAEIDVWVSPVAVGQALPTLPLRLTGDLMVPVDFETTYMDVCRGRRML